jgi:photosystem II stability/assembly factor-like uncharacterized protein
MNAKFTFILGLITLSQYPIYSQWVKTNGPEGISISALFRDGNDLYCGTEAQGVFKSTNNGLTWSNSGLPDKWIDCFLKDNSNLYAGCFGEGVFKSTNGGQTWTTASNGISTEAVYCLLKTPAYIFAGTVGNGLFKSNNGGASWTDANGGALGSSFIHSMVYQDGRLMVEADNYIFFSYDYGNTWDVDQGSTAFYVISDFFQKGDTILAAAFNALFRSVDGGVNWSEPYFISSTAVDFDKVNNTVYVGTGIGLYNSTNWGLTWNLVPPSNLRLGATAFITSGNNFLIGRQEIGITISSNTGQSWSEIPLSQFTRASNIDDSMIFDIGILYSGTHGNGVFSLWTREITGLKLVPVIP